METSDIVRANVAILRRGPRQCYNIGTGTATSLISLYNLVAAELGYKGKPRFVPNRPGDVHLNYLSSTKAKRELGWTARVDVETGIRLTANYFRGLNVARGLTTAAKGHRGNAR